MPYVQCRYERAVYYESKGKGTPLVFIHPPGMGYKTFYKQLPLAKDYQLIFVDLRGNGKSEAGKERITMSLLAEDIKQVLDELKIDQAIILGYSNGGSIAQEFVLSYPERAIALIMSGSFPEVNNFILRNEFKLGIWATELNAINLVANVLATAHCKKHETAFRHELAEHIKRTNPDVLSRMYKAGLQYRSTEHLHEIKVPVLLIYGSLSFYLHHYIDMFKKRLEDVTVVLVEKATHQVPTKHAQEFNCIIKSFIEKKVNVQTSS
ncbi:alpha/beta fold hydrolase [Alkalihalobacterium bogoriense]|uniref:alpha/beta fold hydrolase n=1 Tax=Alkalihalobacterium bogoriense TaxID=246272 RepID=UPI00047A2860|nr:alpha/beta hydrolase [Alkalihalobacterium bogoriense]